MEIISTTPSFKNLPKPSKPKTLGKYEQVSLVSNMFDVFPKKGKMFYQIALRFEPEIPFEILNEKQEQVLASNKRELIKHFGVYFVSGQCIFTLKAMGSKTLLLKNNKEHVVVLEKSTQKQLDLNQISKRGYSDRQELLRILNIVIKNKMRGLGYREFGKARAFYNFSKNLSKGHKLGFDLFEGFKISINCCQDFKLKIVADYSVKIVRNNSLLEEILERANFLGRSKGYDKDDAYYAAFCDITRQQNVIAQYGSKRIYRIDGFEEEMTPLSSFPKNSKGFKTYYDYFLKTYKIKIKDKSQLLVFSLQTKRVQVGGKLKKVTQKIHLVPELLKPTGLTDYQKNNGKLMRELANYTKLSADERMNTIYGKIGDLKGKSGEEDFDLHVDDYSNELVGKQIQFPKIYQKGNRAVPLSQKWGGNFQLRNKICNAVPLKKWTIVHEEFKAGRERVHQAVYQSMKKSFKNFGVKHSEPDYVKFDGRKDQFKKVEKILKEAVKNKTQIVVFMLTDYLLNKGKNYYKKIKKRAAEVGVQTQMLVLDGKSLIFRGGINFKKMGGVVDNVCFQICEKTGSTLLKITEFPYEKELVKNRKDVKEARPCLVGIDVCHKSGRSVVGISGTISKDFTKTRTVFKNQISNKVKEIVDSIGQEIVQIVESYAKMNQGQKPTNIIVYRDGVGEGQIREVNIKEVNSMLSCLKKAFPLTTIDLSVILVTKRINEKFFKFSNDRNYNPSSGLVVDSIATEQGAHQWFMVAQNVTQGCATPTKYKMIFNEAEGVPADYWYHLTYFTTFLYTNWKGPIRVPMVLQNAHTIAFQANICRMENVRKSMLESKYFY